MYEKQLSFPYQEKFEQLLLLIHFQQETPATLKKEYATFNR